MSNNAVVMCTFCLGSMIIIFGLLQMTAWALCFEFCLIEGNTGGNYYLGICSGFMAILVGISGITYLCLLHSYIVIVSLVVDIPLVFLSTISMIISIVGTSEEIANVGTGVVFLIAQSVFCSIITIISTIVAIQFCCIQNKTFKEEEDPESPLAVRPGPERYNPYVDDDSRALPNGGFSGRQPYIVSQPESSLSNGHAGKRPPRRPNGGFRPNVRSPRMRDAGGRTASVYLGRRSPREPNGQQGRPGDHRNDGDNTTLNSFQLGPILGNFDVRGGPGERSDIGNRASGEDVSLPDFNDEQLGQDDARYGDNSNYFF